MTVSPDDQSVHEWAESGRMSAPLPRFGLQSLAGWNNEPIGMLGDEQPAPVAGEPGTVILTCANCGAEMIERKCKLICRCGYFLSCSDYY